MKSERQKVLAGEPYDPTDPTPVADRQCACDVCQALNVTREAAQEECRRCANRSR